MFQRILFGILVTAVSADGFAQNLKEKVCAENLPVISEMKGNVSAILDKVESDSCPKKDNVEDLCNSIFDQKEDSDPESSYVYKYQRIILEASCVNSDKDTQVDKINKINAMWNRLTNKLTCDSTRFNVTNGNILKLAVARRFDSVIEDAAQVWKVNLNVVDPSDQLTVLDYVAKQIDVYKGTVNEALLQEYYKVLKAAGAKHKREL